MVLNEKPNGFKERIHAAFPISIATDVDIALGYVPEKLIVGTSNLSSDDIEEISVFGELVHIPSRVYSIEPMSQLRGNDLACLPVLSCIYTRHHNGFIRQKYLQNIIGLQDIWVAPYVLQLVGEYVVEIIEVIQGNLSSIPQKNCIELLKMNSKFAEVLRQRIISYWDCYYRFAYPTFSDYPGFKVGHRLGLWSK